MTDEIVIESIKKLLALKLSDDEIIGSLIDAGVDYDQAEQLLKQIKAGYSDDEIEVKEPEPTIEKPKKEIRKTAEVKEIEDVDDDVTKEEETPEDEVNHLETTSLGLWQEGVLTTVNQKLDDIETREKEIDKNIEQKVQAITENEIKKMKIILDSQRTLLISKVNTTLDQQVKGITTKLEETLRNMQEINKQTQIKLDELNKQKEKILEIQDNLLAQMDEFNKVRDKTQEFVEEMKGTIEKEANEIESQYDSKLKDVDTKLNSAISLSTKILDGLVSATRKKVDSYYDAKADELITQMREKINKEDYFKDQKEELRKKLEGIQSTVEQTTKEKIGEYLQKLNEVDKKLQQMKEIQANIEETIAVKLEDYLARKKVGGESSSESISDLNRRFAEIENRLKASKSAKATDVDTQLEELILFKDQYAKIVSKLMQDVKDLKEKQKK